MDTEKLKEMIEEEIEKKHQQSKRENSKIPRDVLVGMIWGLETTLRIVKHLEKETKELENE